MLSIGISISIPCLCSNDADPSDSLLCDGDMSDEGAEGRVPVQTHSWMTRKKPVKFQVGAFAYRQVNEMET